MIPVYIVSPNVFIGYIMKAKNAPIQDFDRYFSKYIPTHLISASENVTTPKAIPKIKQLNERVFKITKEYFPSINIINDSGGYTIAQDKFTTEMIDQYIDCYYDYIMTTNIYHDYFLLDIPPCKYFKSWDEIKKYNDKSYQIASNINNGKGIFVFHCHNKNLYDIYSPLFDKYHDKFNRFAVGGVAKSNKRSDRTSIYTAIFKIFLEKCIKFGYKKMKLHILGISSPRVLLMFEMFKQITKLRYDIDFELTTDCSIFQGNLKSKKFPDYSNGVYRNLSFKQKYMDCSIKGTTFEKYMVDILNRFAQKHNIDTQVELVYRENSKGCDMTFYSLLFLQYYDVIRQYQHDIDIAIPSLIDTYLNNKEKFCNDYTLFTTKLNNNNMTKTLYKESCSVMKLLDLTDDISLDSIQGLLYDNNDNLYNSELMTI